jgi:hypothetical protein
VVPLAAVVVLGRQEQTVSRMAGRLAVRVSHRPSLARRLPMRVVAGQVQIRQAVRALAVLAVVVQAATVWALLRLVARTVLAVAVVAALLTVGLLLLAAQAAPAS